MFKLTVSKPFIAEHFLIGGDWGEENIRHPHHYTLELQVSGLHLDGNGYLIDIVKAEEKLAAIVSVFQNKLLNELPDFQGINPSIENLARIAYGFLGHSLLTLPEFKFQVKVWEDGRASVTYQQE